MSKSIFKPLETPKSSLGSSEDESLLQGRPPLDKEGSVGGGILPYDDISDWGDTLERESSSRDMIFLWKESQNIPLSSKSKIMYIDCV